MRPFRGQGKISEAGLGQGEHRDHEVQVGEESQGNDASDAAQIVLYARHRISIRRKLGTN